MSEDEQSNWKTPWQQIAEEEWRNEQYAADENVLFVIVKTFDWSQRLRTYREPWTQRVRGHKSPCSFHCHRGTLEGGKETGEEIGLGRGLDVPNRLAAAL